MPPQLKKKKISNINLPVRFVFPENVLKQYSLTHYG